MSNLFGIHATHVGKIVAICEEELSQEKVQIISTTDNPANRRCYVVIGVESLNKAKVEMLNRCKGTVVIFDSLPSLLRVQDIKILDARSESNTWNPESLRVSPLLRSLRGAPAQLDVVIAPDQSMTNLIREVRSRGILDFVLSAAKSMKPADRTTLHKNVARVIAGELSVNTLRRRSGIKNANIEAYEAMIEALNSPTALRLSRAVNEIRNGADVMETAKFHKVDAFETRFVIKHLKQKTVKAKSHK